MAFVSQGDFPRSRLGEKQRGKILASWVSRKMQTMAQFGIRDSDAEGSVGTIMPEDARSITRRASQQSSVGTFRGSISSLSRTPGTMSSLRHAESVTDLPIDEHEVLGDVDSLRARQFSHDMSGNEQLDFRRAEPYEHDYDDAEFAMRHPYAEPQDYNPGMQGVGYADDATPLPAISPAKQQYLHEDNMRPHANFSRGGGSLRIANESGPNESDDWGAEAMKGMRLGP